VDLPLILGANTTGVLNWYVNALFAVHANMRHERAHQWWYHDGE